MKKTIALFLILILSFFVGPKNLLAECSIEDEKKYQNLIDRVKITYKYENELLDQNNEVINGFFSVYIEGLVEGLSLYIPEKDMLIVGKNEETIKKFGFVYGTYEFRLFVTDSDCEAYKNISLDFPKYNPYSSSYLCNGIDSTEFLPCSKWYEYDLDEETFLMRLKEYQDKKTRENENVFEKAKEAVDIFAEKAIEHIKNYLAWYIVLSLIIISVIIYLIHLNHTKNERKKNKAKWK